MSALIFALVVIAVSVAFAGTLLWRSRTVLESYVGRHRR